MKSEINYLPIEGSESVDSIIHELLHGIIHMFDLNDKMTMEEEEHLVSALSTGITTVMKDNPDLFYTLQDMLE